MKYVPKKASVLSEPTKVRAEVTSEYWLLRDELSTLEKLKELPQCEKRDSLIAQITMKLNPNSAQELTLELRIADLQQQVSALAKERLALEASKASILREDGVLNSRLKSLSSLKDWLENSLTGRLLLRSFTTQTGINV